MKRDPEAMDRALCVDVLAPEGYGEIIGGAQREDDYDVLLERIKEHELDPEDFVVFGPPKIWFCTTLWVRARA